MRFILKSSSSVLYREKCKREGRCTKCGQKNDRLPKVSCSICKLKRSFSYEEEFRRRKYLTNRVRDLEKRIVRLENAISQVS